MGSGHPHSGFGLTLQKYLFTVWICDANSTRSNWFFFPDLSGSTSWNTFGHVFISIKWTKLGDEKNSYYWLRQCSSANTMWTIMRCNAEAGTQTISVYLLVYVDDICSVGKLKVVDEVSMQYNNIGSWMSNVLL